ncbi:hypothetical protein N7495_001111 [Penicillium taxi]|uniref:uncharacterized protein n=1 Tax=Penicillium taxi TaxID=168475 RepID=UPI0025451A2F|nr:uncharacterized protein N7495_001111 [Penicillium taxi]KAJ5908429.1 hypothetical protein N7495_001111 [Penicillium taxi]
MHFSRTLVQNHEQELDVLLQDGTYKPVFLYHLVLFHCLPLVGLIIPYRRGTRFVRPFIFTLCVGIAVEAIRNHRALLGAGGYVVGLMTAWWLVWSATLFIFSDVENDFCRIERRSVASYTSHDTTVLNDKSTSVIIEKGFHWQSYPAKLSHRVDWCAGLLFNLRGPEWNWRVTRLGPLPRSVYAQLHSRFISGEIHALDDHIAIDGKTRLRDAFYTFLKAYLVLDILKAVMMRDPYFRGEDTIQAALPFPLFYFGFFPFAARFYRCFLSCMGVYVALNYVTSLNPLFFLGLSRSFPSLSRSLTAAPLDEAWLYAETFGPFGSSVLDHGLGGVWGRWWHQLFRCGFTAPTRWIFSILPKKWSNNLGMKRAASVVIAFSISGFVHACGSYTQITHTRPIYGPFLFFFMQGIAVVAENIFQTIIFPNAPISNTPRWLQRTTNAVFVFFGSFILGLSSQMTLPGADYG